MRPGDLIEWTYTHNNQLVIERETLWSTLMKRWAPIGSGFIHTLISINDERITWMNEKGLFRARVGDSSIVVPTMPPLPVVPRARG